MRAVGITIVILIAVLVPVYGAWKQRADSYACKMNVGQIGKAIGLYAEQNDDRFPPVYATAPNAGPGLEPLLDERGTPFTWASLIADGMNGRTSFKCPSADPKDNAATQRDAAGDLPTSYGMYWPYGGFPRNLVENPDSTVLVAETCNSGAQGTYDPVPFVDAKGNRIGVDGFLIGYDTSNFDATGSHCITRLAFYGTSSGKFPRSAISRHDGGIHALYCDGHTAQLKPDSALITFDSRGFPTGPWVTPPILKQSH